MRRTVIITGANSGIGKAAVYKFASEGHKVIMACRNISKSQIVQAEINKFLSDNTVDLLELDVSSIHSIENFCKEVHTNYKTIDIIVNNAAYFNHGEKNYKLSKDGIELTFATNTVGPYLLTYHLLDKLEKSSDPRVLNACTTNIRHFFDSKRRIDFGNLMGENKEGPYNVYKMYGDSKIALLMLTFIMAEAYADKGVKVNAIQIPAVKLSKESLKKFSTIWRIAGSIQSLFSLPTEELGNAYYNLCVQPCYSQSTGELFNHSGEIVKSSHYGTAMMEDIKQFKDKMVYPRYADDVVNRNNIWEFVNQFIS